MLSSLILGVRMIHSTTRWVATQNPQAIAVHTVSVTIVFAIVAISPL